MNIIKMELLSTIESFKKSGFNKYDQLTHFVSGADSFITLFESTKFTPSLDIGRLYLKDIGVDVNGVTGDADLTYLMENNVEDVENWFNERRTNMLKLFMSIAFSNINSFYSIMGRTRWNSRARSEDYLQNISDILDKDDPLSELSIVSIVDMKNGYVDSDKELQGIYNYEQTEMTREVANDILSKLNRLIRDNNVHKRNMNDKIIFTTLRLLFGNVDNRKDNIIEYILKREYGVRKGASTINTNKLITINDISRLWQCVGSTTKKDNVDIYNGVLFTINMMVLSTLLVGESITPKRDNDDEPKLYAHKG